MNEFLSQDFEIPESLENALAETQPLTLPTVPANINNLNRPDYSDPKIQHHKSQFEAWLHENYDKDSTSFVLNQKDYDEIKDVLKGVKTIHDANKRFAFKKKKYKLIDNVVHRLVEGETKQIVYLEQFFEIIYEIHCIQPNHLGIQKTFNQIALSYIGVTREIVSKFRQFCHVCELKAQDSQDDILPNRSKKMFIFIYKSILSSI